MKWRMLLYSLLAYMLSIIIIGMLAVWGWIYLVEYQEYKAIEILASREIDNGVAVYAQFSVSQTFEVIQPDTEVKKIILPLYIPDVTKSALITLVKEGEGVAAWGLNSDANKAEKPGVYEMELMLAEPIIFTGSYRIIISAYDISHEDKDLAPRVFVEKDDSKYEGGSYWIAGNKKTGDMSVQIIGQKTRWQKLLNKWKQDPLQGVIMISSWWLLALILGVGPHVLLRRVKDVPINR